MTQPTFSESLFAGAAAGLAVDLTLYPLDTLKTRLQSKEGFRRSGGFQKLYAGVPSAAVGSAPGSAAFFVTYELVHRLWAHYSGRPENGQLSAAAHLTAASLGETVACIIRVPTEVLKQRAQADPNRRKVRIICGEILASEGFRGLYKGFGVTLAREIPFSMIQFPLWEALKAKWAALQGAPVSGLQSAFCGCFAGAVAGGLTTPLDVAKTRTMLRRKIHPGNAAKHTLISTLREMWAEGGVKTFSAGFTPRIMWISLGGFIFLGTYDAIRNLMHPKNQEGALTAIPWKERVAFFWTNWWDGYFDKHFPEHKYPHTFNSVREQAAIFDYWQKMSENKKS